MAILGIAFTHHDVSVCILSEGKVQVALAKERITRVKRDGIAIGGGNYDVLPLIEYCLHSAGLDWSSIDKIVYNHIDHLRSAQLFEVLPLPLVERFRPIETIGISHHFAHALCAAYLCPFDDCSILVVDGGGGPYWTMASNCQDIRNEILNNDATLLQELTPVSYDLNRERESFFEFNQNQFTTLRKIIGSETYCGVVGTYAEITRAIFDNALDAGKTMGLSAFPAENQSSFAEPWNSSPISYRSNYARDPRYPAFEQAIADHRNRLGTDYARNRPAVDLAVGAQKQFEQSILQYARWLKENSSSKNLCICGGGALNCCANSLVAQQAGFDQVFIPPCPGDDGTAIGCAFFAALIYGDSRRLSCGELPYWGGNIGDVSQLPQGVSQVRLSGETKTSYIARILSDGGIVGWCEGRSEFGPRALGHRSLLADPRVSENKERLNALIKRRENFRPFAPIVMEPDANAFFHELFPSTFMSFVAEVRQESRGLIPAAVHVDGTARYQILREQENPSLYALLGEFKRLTGLPVLLNTSFNEAGEPLIETSEQALRFVKEGRIQHLVINEQIFTSV